MTETHERKTGLNPKRDQLLAMAKQVTDHLSVEIVVHRKTGEEYLEAGLKMGDKLYVYRIDFDKNVPFLNALLQLKGLVEAIQESETSR